MAHEDGRDEDAWFLDPHEDGRDEARLDLFFFCLERSARASTIEQIGSESRARIRSNLPEPISRS
jgi:hypothetical protein